MGRTAIFGGTFDPPHNGHLILVQEALERAHLERILVVPAARSPTKPAAPGLPDSVRLTLLQEMFAGLPACTVDPIELERPQPSYTVETLEILAARPGTSALSLLVGVDTLAELDSWREPRRVCALASFLVAARPPWNAAQLPDAVRTLPGLRIELLDNTPVGISSTQIRERCRQGLGLVGFVPDCVLEKLREGPWYDAPGST